MKRKGIPSLWTESEPQLEITVVPNGDDKNWVRLCGAIDGFRVKYVKWPSKFGWGEGMRGVW